MFSGNKNTIMLILNNYDYRGNPTGNYKYLEINNVSNVCVCVFTCVCSHLCVAIPCKVVPRWKFLILNIFVRNPQRNELCIHLKKIEKIAFKIYRNVKGRN